MRTKLPYLLLAISSLVAGCSLVVSSLVHDPVDDCDGHPDGTPCTSAELCVSGVCTYSECGDGYVDPTIGEQCDDANVVAGDGCEPGRCRFTCARDAQCERESPCVGNTGCDRETHVCKPAAPLSGAACFREDSSAGTCRNGTCAAAGCGNGVLGAGEECDDTTPGCASDCQYVCDGDTTCSTSDVCANPVACNAPTHTCDPLPAPSCDDADACTAERCDPTTGCASALVDSDSDGYAPGECKPGSSHMGRDCDDANPSRHPGASEMLNSVDEDCDMIVDENPGVNCLLDADGDGWGDAGDVLFLPACPAGRVVDRGTDDCDDGNGTVSPEAHTASATPYCVGGSVQGNTTSGFSCSNGASPSWDWNCDGSAAPSVPTALADCASLSACGGSYWSGAVPACGAKGTLRTCAQSCVLVLCSCANNDSAGVAQRCL